MTDPRPGRAKRSLGQNFLVDPNLQRKIVAAVGAGPDDEVVEIGPGRGALTEHLAGRVRRLVLVELDDDLASQLADRYAGRDDVVVLHGDVLKTDWTDQLEDPAQARVVGNIPYNITSPIVFRVLEQPRPHSIVLLMQKEVAERIAAPVGTKAYGALSVGVRAVARAERLFGVGRNAFRPVPGVDSAVVRLTPNRPVSVRPEDEVQLRRLTRATFQWRRKQMQKTLRDHPDLRLTPDQVVAACSAAGIEPTFRPEELAPDTFVALARALP